MRIKDPDVRKAIETLADEFENLEIDVKDKEDEIDDLEDRLSKADSEINKLTDRVDELEDKVKELEEALAEAYLTDEADDGRTKEGAETGIQCGRELDVLNSTDDKATD